jgi:CRP-like cAMP-binding protein
MSLTVKAAEIAQEMKVYPLFQTVDEKLLHYAASLMTPIEYSAGDVIIDVGQMNDKLYFIRSGIVEVLIGGEKVAEFRQAGEVMGEMSDLTGKATTAKIRAQSAVRCFQISARDFIGKDAEKKHQLELLLHRFYVSVLTERIAKINEKAKLYEQTARELALKTRELEVVTAAQINFLRSETSQGRKKVLLLEPNKKQQNIIKTAVGGAGVDIFMASSLDEGKQHFSENKPDLICCDSSFADFLFWTQQQNYLGESILLESGQIDFNRLSTLPFVQNVVSRNLEDRVGTAKSIITSLSKILHNDYFGIEKYLAWGTEVRSLNVTGSKDREPIKEQLAQHFQSLGIRGALLERVKLASEEMMMNAVYDAPMDAEGTALFNHLPRTTSVQLHLNQQAQFRFGCDGNVLAVSIQDPFGSLPRYVIINYLQSCYSNQAGHFNSAKGGAGRGLHQILETCDWTIFNVKPGEKTEVIGLFGLDQKQAELPQFHYFFLK